MKPLARLGFILLGVYGTLASLRGVSYFIRTAAVTPPADSGQTLSALIITASLFDLAPPILLIWFSKRLADFAFPFDQEASLDVGASSLVSAGVSVLGVYVAAIGVSGLVGAAVAAGTSVRFLENPAFREGLFSGLGESVALVLIGLGLFVYGPRLVSGREGRAPAA